MLRKKNKPARLRKKISYTDRIKNWGRRNKPYLILLGGFVAMGVFIIFCFAFIQSGTESGLWYNKGGI